MKAEVCWATSVQVIPFRKLKTWPGAGASRCSGPAAGDCTCLHQQGTGPCPFTTWVSSLWGCRCQCKSSWPPCRFEWPQVLSRATGVSWLCWFCGVWLKPLDWRDYSCFAPHKPQAHFLPAINTDKCCKCINQEKETWFMMVILEKWVTVVPVWCLLGLP